MVVDLEAERDRTVEELERLGIVDHGAGVLLIDGLERVLSGRHFG
jgi:hypothetical protein